MIHDSIFCVERTVFENLLKCRILQHCLKTTNMVRILFTKWGEFWQKSAVE